MATTKVSALSAKTSLAGSEELLINDSGTSKKVTATNLLAGVSVADGSISTAKLAADSVTGAKIADDAIDSEHYTDGSIDTAHIADDAVTAAKLANSINTEIAANTAKVTNATHTGDVTGATALTIAADAVTGAKIADDAIDSEHIVDGSIDTAHIGDDQVTAAKLANSINTDIATGVTANTTANAALPKAGGTLTGDLTLNGADIVKSGSADLTIDSGGRIDLSADDNGEVRLFDGSLHYGQFREDGNTFVIQNVISNADLHIQGNDGGSVVTALAFDMSDAGKATFNSGATFGASVTSTTDTDTSNTGSVTLDFATNQNFVLTLTGNVTLANPSTEAVGQSGFITFIQDGTGSRTVSLGTDYETAGAAGLTLTSTASATDIVPYVVVASGRILLGTPQLAFA
jgi:hypothetical protein